MSTTTLTPPPPKYNSSFEAQFDPDQAQLFVITKLLRSLHTADLVKVLTVYPTAGKVGFVDVQPLVLNQDTNGFVIAQTPIYKIPYFQLQGGHSAVILAPSIGDIGLAIFAERDITNVIATQKEGAAPTQRTFNTADGLYVGGVLNPDPTQWVKFNPAGGIDISSADTLTLEAATTISLNAPNGITQTCGSATLHLTSTDFTSSVPITAPEVNLPNGAVNTHYHFVPSTPGNSGVMTG